MMLLTSVIPGQRVKSAQLKGCCWGRESQRRSCHVTGNTLKCQVLYAGRFSPIQ